MTKRAKKSARIDTPEDVVQQSWLNAEHLFDTGAGEPAVSPVPEPHPNEVATRAAVDAGTYTAEEVGLVAEQ